MRDKKIYNVVGELNGLWPAETGEGSMNVDSPVQESTP